MSGYYYQSPQPPDWLRLPPLQAPQPPPPPPPQRPSADQAPAARTLESEELVAVARDFAQNLHEHPCQTFRVYRHKKSGFRTGPATPLAFIVEWKPEYDTAKTSPIISITAGYDSSPYQTFQQLCIAAAESLDPRNCSGYICRWTWVKWANRDIDGIRVRFEVDSFPPSVYPLVRVLEDGSEYKLHKWGHRGGKPTRGPGGVLLPKSANPQSSSHPSTLQAQDAPASSAPEQWFTNATTDLTTHVGHRRSQSYQSRHHSKTSHRHRHSQDLSSPPLPYAPTPSGRTRPDFSDQDAVAEYRALAASGEIASSSFTAYDQDKDQGQTPDAMDFTYTELTQTPTTTQESSSLSQDQALMPPPPRPSSRRTPKGLARSEASESRSPHAGSGSLRSGKAEKSHSKRGKKS